MQGILPVGGMYHIGVVVPDAATSMRDFSEVFGIPKWELRNLTDDMFGNPLVRGRKVKQHFISALGVGGPISFELCQPFPEDRTLYNEFLHDTGPGLHHIFPSVMNEAEFTALLPAMEERGLVFAQSAQISDTVDYWYVDTQDRLGTLVEIVVLKHPEAIGRAPDKIIEFGGDVIAQPGRLPIDKLYHYAVVGRQPVLNTKRGYEDVFGIADWYDFENRPGETVTNSHYDGVSASFEFRAWSGRKGQLGVEMVEPTSGASIFEEKLARGGPGMHHIMTTIMDAQTWDATSKWLSSKGMPVAQDAWTPDGSVYIAFIDAREKLAGMYLEVLVRRDSSVRLAGPVADIMIGRQIMTA